MSGSGGGEKVWVLPLYHVLFGMLVFQKLDVRLLKFIVDWMLPLPLEKLDTCRVS